ncbi:alpha/beta hydrolase [Pseudomonas sp. GCM10022188]|uniref:alpha/beta hydrolase n=1 Tax=Pseudomonas TaxID=286 RepID=UPI001E3129B9|nr:alpha/beta hydrolase [Pseudomonas oryzagri]MCC6073913.1 alpha/beta hydrolase fold domain-containing protein [Pseudomonas oryzagri]
MSLDPQIAALLQQMAAQPAPDYARLDAATLRQATRMPPMCAPTPLAEVRELSVAGAAGPLAARLYRPQAQPGLPLLVFYHGGGFVLCDLDSHDELCRRLALLSGAVVVSVDYRRAPEARYPAAALDAFHALRDLAGRGDELQVDTSRLAVAGDSAGANLAIVACLQAAQQGGPRVAYQCLFYPVTDLRCASPSYDAFADGYLLSREMMHWYREQYLERPEQAEEPLASPLLADDFAQLPATTLLSAEFDPLRDEGEAFAERLQAAGVAVRVQRAPGMIHGFISFAPVVEGAAAALALAAADLRNALA